MQGARQGRADPGAACGAYGLEAGVEPPDPVGLLERQDATREPDLVPVRHGRIFQGAATGPMASAWYAASG